MVRQEQYDKAASDYWDSQEDYSHLKPANHYFRRRLIDEDDYMDLNS